MEFQRDLTSVQPWLAIVVPVWNEAENIPKLAEHLLPLVTKGCEVLLVDGGSSDNTVALACEFGLPIITSASGRARQMNTGAQATCAPVLLFLHADTRLPNDAVELISDALYPDIHGVDSPLANCWGRFDVCISGEPWMLKLIARMINLRSRYSKISTGDQAQFFKRSVFNQVGGFADQPLMEDIEISKRMKAISSPASLKAKVVTSGRRWESRGVWKTILLMWRLRWAYWRGADATELAVLYR